MNRKLCAFLAVLFALTTIAWAQEMGTVTGTVVDSNGDPLPGVQITIGTQTRITDEDGSFSLELPPGDYRMIAALEGFTLAERNITVTAAGLTLDVTMMAAVRETVTVTGSFIPGQVLEEGPAPIRVMDVAEYRERGSPDFEEVIRQMPEMYGHVNIANQYTASTFNIGIRSANLRGLGSHRNLVLLNGRRSVLNPVATEQGGAVDLAAFPRIAMKRVEVLKEASPLYGSDAITGVVNYITDDRFTGIKAEVNYTDIANSDGDLYAGFMKGWEVGRLNLILAIEYNERNKVRIWDTDWYRERNDGSGSWLIGSSFFGNPGGFISLGPTGAPSGGAFDPACGSTDPTTGATSFVHPRTFQTGLPFCGFYYTQFTNFVEPQQRINIFSQFNLEVNDKQEVYGHLLFSRNDADYTPSPTYPPTNPDALPGVSPATYIPPFNPGLADFVSTLPPEQRINWAAGALYLGRPVGMSGMYGLEGKLTQEWRRNQQTFQFQGGVRGEWGDGPTAVHYDFAASYGSTTNQLTGEDVLIDRWAAANWGMGGPECDPETGTPGVPPCYFWNNFYTGWTSSDPALRNRGDVFEWMNGDTGSKSQFDELHAYADFSGATSLKLGGGPMAWAAGYEFYYSESFLGAVGQSYSDSPLYDPNPFNFLWMVTPFGYPDPFSADSHAVYLELLFPFADTFELNLAGRYTNAPWLDTDYTKGRASLRWTPVPQLVLRGSFSQGLLLPSPWWTERWDRKEVNVSGSYIPIEILPANMTGGLEAEEADSINLGFVWHPVPQVTLSADFWQIDFTNPIGPETPGYVLENHPERVEFNPDTGLPQRVFTHTVNGPDLEARGYDFAFNWDIPSSAGVFSLGFEGSLLDRYLFREDPSLPTEEYDALGRMNGRYGESPVLVYTMPELKYNAYAGWQKGRHSLRAVYYYVDGYRTELTGVDRIPTNSPPYDTVDSWGTYDLYYQFRIPSWHTTFNLSVINATDEDPPIVWEELAYDAMTHNPLGRRLKVGVTYQF
jgi:iron complex outermembrane receptor protein